jgi:hypothetical protein
MLHFSLFQVIFPIYLDDIVEKVTDAQRVHVSPLRFAYSTLQEHLRIFPFNVFCSICLEKNTSLNVILFPAVYVCSIFLQYMFEEEH